ncbi:MAG: hypothetical protein FJ109_14890, partial [Deltaproteobacteria bacterium]|nr:hypothetical protein [Deltaproteobacteria bacterium]
PLGGTKAIALNGGIAVDVAWGEALALPKQGKVVLSTGDDVLDVVFWGPDLGLVAPPGVSLSLEPSGETAKENDLAAHWCLSAQPFGDGMLLASPGLAGQDCDSDQDGFDEGLGDCDDADPKVYPEAAEKCNGFDDDCNGETDDEPLSDMPPWTGVGVCADGGPVCEGLAGWVMSQPAQWEQDEVSCDGLDNDCDGQTDEGLRNACGSCGFAYPDLCDGLDNDCDGATDEDALLPPADFHCSTGKAGLCKDVQMVCAGEWKCIYPVGYEVEETLCDGLDNDCDGQTDEGYELSKPCSAGTGACRAEGVMVCGPDKLSLVCQATADPGLVELCGDNIDNDCDGETDEGYAIGETCAEGIGACRVTGKLFCSPDRLAVVCSVQPLEAGEEVCSNLLDDDCDGETDEQPCGEAVHLLPQTGCSAGMPERSGLTFLLLLSIPVLLLAAGMVRRSRARRTCE